MKNDYPRFMFHQHEPPCIVNSEAEEKALGAEWSRSVRPDPPKPQPQPEPEPEPELPDDDEENEEDDEEDLIAKQEPAKVAAAPAPAPVPLKKRAPVRPPTKPKARKR